MSVKCLQGLKILVTRPRAQAQELAGAIRDRGGEPVLLPLLQIEALDSTADRARLQQQIQSLDNYQLLIFVSTNAARLGAELIDQYWPQFPVGVDVLAVGPSTAHSLQQLLSCAVQVAPGGVDSEALLALPVLSDLNGKKVAIFRGVGGRELLADTLRQRGASVDYIELYRRQAVSYPGGHLQHLLRTGVDLIQVSSGESLQQILQLAGDNKAELTLLPLLVPSQRVAEIARRAGFETVIDAAGADLSATLAALQEYSGAADNKA